METYTAGMDLEDGIIIDKYAEIVLTHYEKKYGKETRGKLLSNGLKIFTQAEKQLKKSSNHNLLLVGKVQSGKTANLELLTGLFFDNNYVITIIYGGYDKKLLSQTVNRFKNTFKYEHDDNNTPYIISTSDEEDISEFDYLKLKELTEQNRPIIVISMKRTHALQKVINLIDRLSVRLKSIIIDDEGDQASLNTQFKKEGKSATYSKIVKMKGRLYNPLYFSVTATPHANIFLSDLSELRPESVLMIPPFRGYTGSEFFHLDETKIFTLTETEIDNFEASDLPATLELAIYHYLIASAIMRIKGIIFSDMIIHTAKEIYKHNKIFNNLTNFISYISDDYYNNGDYNEALVGKFSQIFHDSKYFSNEIQIKYFFEDIKKELTIVTRNTYIVLQNGIGQSTQVDLDKKQHKVYIGGDLIQRGLTFENLVTTYFTRWAKTAGNMDTTIQRCRWFGYRSKYLDICKVFTSNNIMFELAGLASSESDLWQQLIDVEEGRISIGDIIVDASDSTLNPTRKSVADYEKIGFNSKWKSQREGIFDKFEINHNNKIMNEIIGKYTWNSSSVGRLDGKTSCYYSVVDKEDINKLFNETKRVFSSSSFSDNITQKNSSKKVILQLMYDPRDESDIRNRTFDEENKVSALQQGANSADPEKVIYRGDSYVLVDASSVCIQVFRVLAYSKITEPKSYTQYMYSVYYPQSKSGFIRG